jgi:hypothetical protein
MDLATNARQFWRRSHEEVGHEATTFTYVKDVVLFVPSWRNVFVAFVVE